MWFTNFRSLPQTTVFGFPRPVSYPNRCRTYFVNRMHHIFIPYVFVQIYDRRSSLPLYTHTHAGLRPSLSFLRRNRHLLKYLATLVIRYLFPLRPARERRGSVRTGIHDRRTRTASYLPSVIVLSNLFIRSRPLSPPRPSPGRAARVFR